jgi:hypothetical protein
MIISRSVLLRMTTASHISCRDKQIIYYVCSNFIFRNSYHLWDNVEKYCTDGRATDGNKIWRMCIACWITKTTDTHSEDVILIAFLCQHLLRERASMLPYTHNACLVFPRHRVKVIGVFRLTLGLPNGLFSPVLSNKKQRAKCLK